LLTLTGFFPIRAMAFWAYLRLFVEITWNPFILATRAVEYSDLLLFFIHTSNISLIICFVQYFINNILFIVAVVV